MNYVHLLINCSLVFIFKCSQIRMFDHCEKYSKYSEITVCGIIKWTMTNRKVFNRTIFNRTVSNRTISNGHFN